jgi:hypothetical protein
MDIINPSKCLLNVTQWYYQLLKMFMWMLHNGVLNSSICLCECYIMALSTPQYVHSNVHYQLLKIFTWMLHIVILLIKFSTCSCEARECYILTLSTSQYVLNVTSWCYQVLEMFMWMLHDDIINSSKCLCECYIVTLSTSQSWMNVYVTREEGFVTLLVR